MNAWQERKIVCCVSIKIQYVDFDQLHTRLNEQRIKSLWEVISILNKERGKIAKSKRHFKTTKEKKNKQ